MSRAQLRTIANSLSIHSAIIQIQRHVSVAQTLKKVANCKSAVVHSCLLY